MKSIPALTIAYMTRIPMRVQFEAQPEDYARCVPWFALSSLAVGALSGLVFEFFLLLGLSVAACVAAVAMGYLLTGAMHLDGWADTADAFFAFRDREATLRILKDSRQGTFGVLAIVLCVALKIALLYGVLAGRGILAAVLAAVFAPVAGKLPLVLCAWVCDYARADGKGKHVIECLNMRQAVVSMAASALLLGLACGLRAVVYVPLGLLAGGLMCVWSNRKIGGATGDVLGACNELGELLFLLTMGAILWFI